MRFEEPSSMVRWDSPLFTIPWDEAPPFDTIWNTITTGAKAPPTSAVVVVRPSLIPPARADVPQRPRPPPNTLKTLTTTTSTITTSLLSHINASPSASTFPIPSPPAPVLGPLFLHLPMRRVTLPEMQRLKRQYEGVQIKAQASGGRAGGRWAEWEVAVGFVGFLEAAWDTGQ
jgi:protein KTI12